ncbi:MAG TPA: type VI secretion system-associated FHA domain protein TagH, partial [Steroidobacteraceae bacterium]|nr:type VI secretion system-associated FHA domain protein TagH [Steroidobacteraceae bacterium]
AAQSSGSAGGQATTGPASGSSIPDDYDPLSDLLSDSSPSRRGRAAPPPPPPVQAPHMTTQAQQPNQASPPATQGVSRPMPGGNRQPTVAPRVTAPLPPSPPPVPPVARAPARVAAPAQPAAPPPRPASPPTPRVDTAATGRQPQVRNDNGATGTNRQIDMNALLIGAGLSDAQITPELVENFGRILRVVVAGLMDVLRARERIKDEFRMRMTTFKVTDNNPLKFSANVDDALHNLLVKRNAAYLGPVEAFDDAFQDVRNHQMAMLAGVRVAFESMLSEFDPERLREQFDPQVKKGSLLAGPAKLRYWELYVEKFRGMVNDQESTFRDLFGEEFARAYEEQLERLKAAGRAGKK